MRLKTLAIFTFLTISLTLTHPTSAWACTNGTDGVGDGGGGMEGHGAGCHGGNGADSQTHQGGQGGMGYGGANGGDGGGGHPGEDGGVAICDSNGCGRNGNSGPNWRVIPTTPESTL